MRTHDKIIADAGGPMEVKRRLNLVAPIHTVRSWSARKSIPAEYWQAFAANDLASLEELAADAVRRLPAASQVASAA